MEGEEETISHEGQTSTLYSPSNHVAHNTQPISNIRLLSWSMVSLSVPCRIRAPAVGRH